MDHAKRHFVNEDTKVIARNLKNIRQCYGVSQQEIADVLDVTFQQIQKYEKGVNRLSAEKLFLLKSFYALPYEAFFKDVAHKTDRVHRLQGKKEYICMLLDSCNQEERDKVVAVISCLIN